VCRDFSILTLFSVKICFAYKQASKKENKKYFAAYIISKAASNITKRRRRSEQNVSDFKRMRERERDGELLQDIFFFFSFFIARSMTSMENETLLKMNFFFSLLL
jgi:hypothetical protein